MVPLNTPLANGQRVEIIAAKQGGPSRDWLNPALGYIATKTARAKVRAWFASLALEESLSEGRSIVNKDLQRLGASSTNIDELATKLGYAKAEDLFIAAARNELNTRALQALVRGSELPVEERVSPESVMRRRKASESSSESGILIVGVDKLLTQLARCCKPAPPDVIQGFVTRGKGVSIHRADCPNFLHLVALHPERVIETEWGGQPVGVFPVDIVVDAHDRQGLLRDISDVFAREKMNVLSVNTMSMQGTAHMSFTVEIDNVRQLYRTLTLLHEVGGVVGARRS
jgi:GTP pyrophosphokinase